MKAFKAAQYPTMPLTNYKMTGNRMCTLFGYKGDAFFLIYRKISQPLSIGGGGGGGGL